MIFNITKVINNADLHELKDSLNKIDHLKEHLSPTERRILYDTEEQERLEEESANSYNQLLSLLE